MFTRLSIKDWRQFSNIDIVFHEHLTVLTGANGAGKTTVLNLLSKSTGWNPQFVSSYEKDEKGVSKYFNSLKSLGQKLFIKLTSTNDNQAIKNKLGELEFSDSKSIDTYSFSLANAAPDRLILTEERIVWHRSGEVTPYEIILEPRFKESALADSDNPVAKSIFQMLSRCKVYQFHDSSEEGPLRQVCPVETANYLQSHGNNLPSFLLFLRENYRDSYNRIVDYVKDVVPQFQDFYLEPNNRFVSLRWMDNSATDYRFNAYQFSDGSIRFIALATLLLQPPQTMPNVIIIDEPELGLHPYAITQLAEMIKDASIHAQIILATQSKDLVDHFDIDDISVIEMDEATQSTSVTHLNDEEYHQWLMKYTVSELWDKNVIGGRPV